MQKAGQLIVISGPSGTGKGTICKRILATHPEIKYSISMTTRTPRPGEIDGRDYYFTSKEHFQELIAQNQLLEWAEVYGNYYGTPLKQTQEELSKGRDVILEIDTQGALNVQKICGDDALFIFLVPPSLSELESRIRGRGTETEESICRRLGAALEELVLGVHYDYIVVNDDIEVATNKVLSIITAQKCAIYNNLDILDELNSRK